MNYRKAGGRLDLDHGLQFAKSCAASLSALEFARF